MSTAGSVPVLLSGPKRSNDRQLANNHQHCCLYHDMVSKKSKSLTGLVHAIALSITERAAGLVLS